MLGGRAGSCLYDVVQDDGNISIPYVNTKQQCADICMKGYTNAEMWNTFMSTMWLFDIDHQKIAKLQTQTSCHQEDMCTLLWRCNTFLMNTQVRSHAAYRIMTPVLARCAPPSDVSIMRAARRRCCLQRESCLQISHAKPRAGGDSLPDSLWQEPKKRHNDKPPLLSDSWAGGDSSHRDRRRTQNTGHCPSSEEASSSSQWHG